MAMPNATIEQVSIVESSQVIQAEPLGAERVRREGRRERLARHLAGDSLPSNFEAMCQVIAGGLEPCDACGGHGFRPLPRHVRDEYDDREENRLEEIKLLQSQISGAEVPDEFEGAAYKTKKLIQRLVDTEENQRDDRKERNRRSVCRRCKGSGYGPRRKDGAPGRTDSMFTTVPCPRCRGADRRQHPALLNNHYGSSCGEIMDRDDAAAERHDQCPTCVGIDGMGTGYVEPITVRPSLRTSGVQEDPSGIQDLDKFPAGDFSEPPLDDSDPADFLERARREDPMLAAAIACYVGQHGDECAARGWGNRFALWPLTDAGGKLASESTAKTLHEGGYERALALCVEEQVAAQQAEHLNPRRSALIRMADTQARILERRVERALAESDAA